MDARYNWIIDNVAIRVGINVAVFALWLGAAVTALYMLPRSQFSKDARSAIKLFLRSV